MTLEEMIGQIICSDCLEVMKSIPDKSIDLTVTSPPYDKLRNYKGYVFDFESVAKELFRITKVGGVVVWIVNDQTKNGSESGTSFRQALYFMSLGFNLYDTMIYAKTNPIVLNHRRYNQQFEFMFVFTKGRPVFFRALREKCITANRIKTWDNPKFENDGKFAKKDTKKVWITKETRIKNNIFYYTIGNEKQTGIHPCPFPEALAHDQIFSWSRPEEIVLDPFCGSGTTPAAAKKLNRRYIGIDISPEYCEISEKRLRNTLYNEELAL